MLFERQEIRQADARGRPRTQQLNDLIGHGLAVFGSREQQLEPVPDLRRVVTEERGELRKDGAGGSNDLLGRRR
jgi:hypothetical protein